MFGLSIGFIRKAAACAAATVAAVFGQPAYAQSDSDSAMLKVLVSRGVLTEQEAADIAKSSAEIPVVRSAEKSVFSIKGGIQVQHAYIDSNIHSGANEGKHARVNGFMMRRVITTFKADVEDNYGALVSLDFILPHHTSNIYMYKNIDSKYAKGQLRFGYIKPNFCLEEYTSAFNQYCPERSLATNYFTGSTVDTTEFSYRHSNYRKIDIGGFMTGAYWYGKSQSVKGLDYSFAVTNSENYEYGISNLTKNGQHNAPDIWAGVVYSKKFDDKLLKFGLNGMYGEDGNKAYDAASVPFFASRVFGFNPFLHFEARNFKTTFEFLVAHIEKGCRDSATDFSDNTPLGLNYAVEYLFDTDWGKIGPVFRYAYLDTDGRGTMVSDGLRKAKNPVSKAFDKANSFYIGANWYIIGNSLKVQLGYEFARLWGKVYGNSTDESLFSNSVRTEIQILY